MNNLSNIVVYIKDAAELQQAREVLERYNQPYNEDRFYLGLQKVKRIDLGEWDYLSFGVNTNRWSIGIDWGIQNKITLTELEQLLKQNRE